MEKNILHAGEVRVESGSNFDQGGKAPVHNHAALGRLHDAAQNLERSAFSGAVAADDAERFPALDLERDVLQGPKLALVTGIEFLPLEHFAGHGGQKIAQGIVNLTLAKFLVDMLHA